MLKDFEILEYQFNNEINIVPIADTHIGASGCMLKELKEKINEIANTPNTYVVLVGDIIDNAIINSKSLGIFDNVLTPMQQIQEASKLFKPLADNGQILSIISGNHEQRSIANTDINPMYLFATELGLGKVYRDNLAIHKIKLGERDDSHRATYTIMTHHGKGTAESMLKKGNEYLNTFENVDAIVLGHSHAPRVAKYNKKFVDTHNNKVIDKETTIIVTNSFLGDSSYAVKGMYGGVSHAMLNIRLTKNKKNKKIIVNIGG